MSDDYKWKDNGYLHRTKNSYKCWCPICTRWFEGSDYLATVFDDPKLLLLANLVTHYRHDHIRYDRNYGFVVHYKGYMTREEYRSDINERAKRQYARKCTLWLKDNKFVVDDIRKLQGTTQKTIEVWEKKLSIVVQGD